ncbi:MAG: YrbL family protein [Pseudoxanthomonas sp.]
MNPSDDPRWAKLQVIAHGANRLCAIDPDDPAHCLKFELPVDARTRVGARQGLRRWLARHWPRFDENHVELRAWQRLQQRHGDEIGERFAACKDIVATRWGEALRCRCLRLPDGQPARSLYAHLFNGPAEYAPAEYSADALCAAVDDFEHFLIERGIPLFDLNAGNFVVLPAAAGVRLVCVDAKSTVTGKEILPLSRWLPGLRRRKIARRAQRLRQRIRDAFARPPSDPCTV